MSQFVWQISCDMLCVLPVALAGFFHAVFGFCCFRQLLVVRRRQSHMHTTRFSLSLLLALCLGLALPMWSQSTNTGTVAGAITDQSSAVVAGAAVTLIDASTNIARSTT